MLSNLFVVFAVLGAFVTTAAHANDFPHATDYLTRALVQKLPPPLVLKRVTVTEDLSQWQQFAVTTLENKAKAFSVDSTYRPKILKTSLALSNASTVECLSSVVAPSSQFSTFKLGPYTDRAATVLIDACQLKSGGEARPFAMSFTYGVILNLDENLAFSALSPSQAFTAVETMSLDRKKLLCRSSINGSGLPNHALAVYETDENYIVGVSIEPTGEVKSEQSSSENATPNYDYPIGFQGQHDLDSLKLELLPTVEFFRSLKGRFQIVFSKSDCIDEGFRDGWPELFCKVSVPPEFRRKNIEELQFRFAKTQRVSRYKGALLTADVFAASFDFVSSETSYSGWKKRYKNTLSFEANDGEQPCQF